MSPTKYLTNQICQETHIMKTKYTNPSNEQAQIIFTDNTSVFLKRGQTHISEKEVKRMSKVIKTTEIRPTKRKSVEDTSEAS